MASDLDFQLQVNLQLLNTPILPSPLSQNRQSTRKPESVFSFFHFIPNQKAQKFLFASILPTFVDVRRVWSASPMSFARPPQKIHFNIGFLIVIMVGR
jgi:hypothetical protein